MDRCMSGWRREHPCAALTPSSRFVVKLTQWEAFARNVKCPPRVDKLSGLSWKGTPFVLCQHSYERRREGKVSNGRTLALQVSPRKARFPRPKRKSSIFQHLAALCPSGHSPVLLQWGSESVRT